MSQHEKNWQSLDHKSKSNRIVKIYTGKTFGPKRKETNCQNQVMTIHLIHKALSMECLLRSYHEGHGNTVESQKPSTE